MKSYVVTRCVLVFTSGGKIIIDNLTIPVLE